MLSLSVDGKQFETDADPRKPFLSVLREDLGIRGAKYGCGEGECGACTIIVDGEAICACLAMTGSLAGTEVTTVAGLANDPIGVRLINSFAEKGAVQCGFCTPGFVMSGWQLLSKQNVIDLDAVRDSISGNLCRCTGYVRIVEAIAALGNESLSSPVAARKGRGEGNIRVPQRYWRPATLEQLLGGVGQFAEHPRFIAGGTDVMVQYEHRLEELALVDISGVRELFGIEEHDDYIRIGATTTWTEIRYSKILKKWAPCLTLAACEIGGIQIQNRGTIGGNLGNASPAGDGLPPLYVHDAEIVSALGDKTKITPIADFITGPGRTILDQGEIILEVRVPKPARPGEPVFFFEKVGPRKAQTITKGSVTFHAWRRDGRIIDPRIALGAVAPTVIRAAKAEHALAHGMGREALAEASRLVEEAARPIDDIRSTADYRRQLVGGLLTRGFLRHCLV
jgi:xanthine dehydrogenase small subunit